MTNHDVESYRPHFAPEAFAELLAELERPALPAIRLNTLKTRVERLVPLWAEWYGWETQALSFCAAGWQLPHCDTPPAKTFEYRMGNYYIQDAASMLPVEMFSPNAPETPLILDMAAAPGGKTTHLVSRFQDRALIVANDSSLNRIGALRANLQQWGAMNCLITNLLGEKFGNSWPETFDLILLDAPCSGGNWQRQAKQRQHRAITPKEQKRLQERQIHLLTSAFQTLKPGGEIVYSTCTVAPEENEAVLDHLLQLYPGNAVIEAITHLPLGEDTRGLTFYGGLSFNEQASHAIRLWPHLFHTTFLFAARIRKTAATTAGLQQFRNNAPISDKYHRNLAARTPTRESPYETRRGRRGDPTWSPDDTRGVARHTPTKIAANDIYATLQNDYGFDFSAMGGDWEFRQQRESIFIVSRRIEEELADIPAVATGFLFGQLTDAGFIPSHELVARFEDQFAGRRISISDDLSRLWLSGRDIPYTGGAVDVPLVLLQDEKQRFLGRGKITGQRIRNLLPKRFFTGRT